MKNFSFSPLIRNICMFFNQSKLKSSLSVATSINVLGNSFAYTFSVTKVVLCPIRYDMVLMSTSLFKAYEANVCRAMWKCNLNGSSIFSPIHCNDWFIVLFRLLIVSFNFSSSSRSNSSSSIPNTKFSFLPIHLSKIFMHSVVIGRFRMTGRFVWFLTWRCLINLSS